MPRTLCYPMASHMANCDNMLPPLLPSQTYGVNAAASWGYQWRQPYATGERGVSDDPKVDRGWAAGCYRQQHTAVSEGVQELDWSLPMLLVCSLLPAAQATSAR